MLWLSGVLATWCCDALDNWLPRVVALWSVGLPGVVTPWIIDYLVLWLSGVLATWCCDALDNWLPRVVTLCRVGFLVL